MSTLTLDRALACAQAALAAARQAGLNPVGVAVIDAGGNLRAGLREDGAGFLAIDLAAGKARAALAFHCTSAEIAGALAGNPLGGASVLGVGGGRLMLLGGGVPLTDADGAMLGAIGVAGDAPDRDEAAARAGADTLAG